MPNCKINLDASPTFRKLLREFRKECPHILEDLRNAFERIERDFRHAAGAHAQPEYGGRIWKYECASRDFKRGAKGAFRIIAYYDDGINTLCPILLYFKARLSKPEAQTIDEALAEVAEILASPTVEVGPSICECCKTSDDTVREQNHTDYVRDRSFVFVLCVTCIDQLDLKIDRSNQFEDWLTVKLAE